MAFQLSDPFGLMFLMVGFTVSVLVGQSALRPLEPEKYSARRPWQCSLTDVLVLVVQLASSAGFVFRPDNEILVSEVLGLVVLWLLQGFWWWTAIRILARKGVESPLGRLVALAVLFPLLYGWPLWSFATSPLFMIFTGMFLLFVFPLALGVYLAKPLARWVAADSGEAPKARPALTRPIGWLLGCGLCVLFTGVITFPLWCGFTVGPVFYVTALRRFRGGMRYRADIPAIQAWMQSPAYAAASAKAQMDFDPRDLPSCVRSLSSRVVRTDRGTIFLIWGGGFGHWGLEVGLPGTAMPPSTPREYHLPLADGAWVWHEIQ